MRRAYKFRLYPTKKQEHVLFWTLTRYRELYNGASAKSGLTKSILDNSLGQFVQIVTNKAACAGRNVVKVNPYKTSQICSACLQECPHKELDERVHTCIHCGIMLDRDTNAAINILRLGRSQQSAMAVEAPRL